MITPTEMEKIVNSVAPAELAEEWDNVGLLVDAGLPTDRILFALDATADAIEEAGETGCGIIVTHHPLIFHPLKRVSDGSAVALALRKGISVISAHTNYDSADGGINDVLARWLDLEKITPVETMGRAGVLPDGPIALKQFASFVKERLGVEGLRVADAGIPVHRVMVLGGSGGDWVAAAKEAGCDTLLTGEAAHHEGIEAKAIGVNLVVAGHFGTENPGMPAFCAAVQKLVGDRAECRVSVRNRDPFVWM